MAEKDIEIIYNAEPTLVKLHASDAFWRVIRGPVRSGKSVGCCNEIFRRCYEQNSFNGIQKSRWAVVRNTYRELMDTTLKTWLDWYPERVFGAFNKNEMTHYLKYGDIEAEIMFRALDIPDDVKKLLSLELTGAWVNEGREVPKAIVDVLGDRVGQYPSKREGGTNYAGVLLDTNSPDTDHWIYRLSEEDRPEYWEFFTQPGALIEVDGNFVSNPLAENIHNLNEGAEYYLKRLSGKSKDYIRVYYCNEYGYVQEGRPVHQSYVDSTHCSADILRPTPGILLDIGLDFGLTPAATIGQKQLNGQWLILDEIVTERMGMVNFCKLLKPILASEYRGFKFHIWGDPAGSQEAQTDERSPFDIMLANGIPAEPAYHNNDPIIRREALDSPLNRMIDGKPGVLISPKCKTLRKALMGGYCFKRIKVSGDERFKDKPDKNKYSHVAESCEYMMLGAGEGAAVIEIAPQKDIEPPPRLHTPSGHAQGWML